MEITASAPVYVRSIQAYPDTAAKEAKLHIEIGNDTGAITEGVISVSAELIGGSHKVPVKKADFRIAGSHIPVRLVLDMGKNVKLWDEFSPNLYRLTVKISTFMDRLRICHKNYLPQVFFRGTAS